MILLLLLLSGLLTSSFPTVYTFTPPNSLQHQRKRRPSPRLNSFLTNAEESLGPILPILTITTSIPFVYIAYNLEEWQIRRQQLPSSRIVIQDVEGKGKGAFLRGEVKKKAVVGVYGGEVSQTNIVLPYWTCNWLTYHNVTPQCHRCSTWQNFLSDTPL